MTLSLLKDRKTLRKHSLFIGCFGLLFMALGLFWLDQRIENFFQQPNMESAYYYSREITNIGYSSHYFIIAILLLIVSKYFSNHIGYLRNNPPVRSAIQAWSVFMLRSLIVAGVIVQISKMIIGRQRPHVAEGIDNLNFEPFSLHWHWHSLPSGHTQVLFSVATVLFLIWPRHRLVFLGLAALLAFTRVVTHQHYFSDFAAGATVGYLTTLWVYYKWPVKTEPI